MTATIISQYRRRVPTSGIRAGSSPRRGRALVVVTSVALAAIILVSLVAPLTPLPDPNMQELTARLLPPVWQGGVSEHILGTDHLGRDLLARLLAGAKLTFLIGFGAMVFAAVIGTTLGILAGYLGGRADAVISRLIEAQLSIPFMLLAIAVLTTFGRSMLLLVLVLSMAGWASYARVIRSEALALRSRGFIVSLRSAGLKPWRILVRHVFPNVFGTFLVLASLEVGSMILAESAVSFLGFGVVAPDISWGAMLAEGSSRMRDAWWLVVFPGLAITVTVVLVNLLGDGLRSLYDPKARSW